MPLKDDIRKLADLEQQISQKVQYYSCSTLPKCHCACQCHLRCRP